MTGHDDDGPGSVVDSRFETTDPEEAEEFIRQVYVDQRLSLGADRAAFRLTHGTRAVSAPRSSGTTLNRLATTLPAHFDARPLDDQLVVNVVRAGGLAFPQRGRGAQAGSASRGEAVLAPPRGEFTAELDAVELENVVLSHREVADRARTLCGLEPGTFRFTGLIPISAPAAHRWRCAVADVRDRVLGDPALAPHALVRHAAIARLAGTVLTVLPNTALAAAHDPHTHPAPAASVAESRHAVEFLHTHAADVLGPTDAADALAVSPRALEAGLRRHRTTSSARELRAARLTGVHDDLVLADAVGADTVAAVAARWGFTHLGRLGLLYLRIYGETLQQTLAR